MTKVAVIGNAGGGKSRLSARLGEARRLPVYALDRLQWNKGWIPTPAHIFTQKHDALLTTDKWIIDGFATWESVGKRFAAADTIIFIDHPLWVHYWWASKRQFMTLLRPRPNFPTGCPMLPKTKQLYKMIWRIHRQLRPRLLDLIDKHKRQGRTVFHIKSPKELNQFIRDFA